ncbi:MAG TPA: BON domain-containing protein [Bryobacteraceae bacterium]|jgi:osmotically-inducible protein OsmY
MKLHQITKQAWLGCALLLGLAAAGPVAAQSSATKSDNSAVNKGDQNPGATTADQQKMNAQDRDISAKIRKAVVGDKSLSTYAHNVKIVSQNGTVTLKGPVRSSDEVQSIMAKATEIAGAGKVVNQMTVQPK